MQDLTLTIFQSNLFWENSQKNLEQFDHKISAYQQQTDLILLPEMFNTGFSVHVEKCAETADGKTMTWMRKKAKEKKCVVAGSLLTREKDKFYNRFIWMKPDGSYDQYDKRHLFSMAGEDKTMSAGNQQTIVELKAWKIALQVCYDLRFPVWSKNTYCENGHAFDILVYIANWPERRKQAYQHLLPARAIENQCYVAWVNRIGKDGNNVYHSGDSAVYNLQGETLCMAEAGAEEVLTISLSQQELAEQRSKFQIGPDWDTYKIL